MSDTAAREILIEGARALAHPDRAGASVQGVLDAMAEQLEVASAAIFAVTDGPGRLEIVASFGLPEAARVGLVEAVANPRHPIARTAADPVASFDVLPTVPGGPALRTHLPLIVTRSGAVVVVGVLALAHDQPIDPDMRPVLQAGADLAAVAIERR
jgi:GAF domain